MTSPDRQVPFGSLAPDALSTLQDMLASPIGEEATEVLGTLAEFGNSLVARFFQGYTSITDVFAHAFDDLGAELGGIPGMSGVTVWVQSIEELVGTALGLIDGVFDGIQAVVDGLSFAVTGNGIEGNIAEGMHAVVEGLTMFLKLVNLAMDLIQQLIDGVLGVSGGTMYQLVQVLSWVIGVANEFLLFFNGIYDVFGDLLDFAPGGDRPLAPLLAGLPKLLSVFSDLDAGKLIGEIPGALLQGVQDAIDDVGQLVQSFMDAVLRAIRGVPVVGGTLADIIAEVGGLQQKAVEAETAATAAQTTATVVQGTVQVQAVTVGVVDGLTVVRTPITSTQTWTRAAIPTGCTERVKTGVGLVASGQGGGRGTPRSGNDPYSGMGGAGGAGGGYVYAEFTPDEVGTSQLVTIGAGGAGATSMSTSGAFGGMTSFGSLLAIASGAGGGIPTSVGVVYGAGSAGDGGDGGNLVSNGQQPGKQGGRAYLVQGGAAGGTNGGNGGAGQNAPTGDDVLSGGSGGGGGGSDGANIGDSGGRGGNGGIPGGGGAGGGGGGYGGNPGNGGNGGRGEALIEEFFR